MAAAEQATERAAAILIAQLKAFAQFYCAKLSH